MQTVHLKRRGFLHCSATAVAAAVFVSTFSGVRADASQPKLQFDADGKFKIAQFTDTHYRTDKKDVAVESVNLIAETLEAEKPQLAVYTGDIVVSGGNVAKGWDDILAPCIAAKVPYAVVLGNHDHEGANISPRGIVDYIAKKSYSVTQLGPENIFGASNYVLEVFDGNKVGFLLYCLDSNAYSQLPGVSGYDWFRNSQISWYRERSAEYTKQNSGKPIPALAFFHIPLNEYGEMIHFKGKEKRNIVGVRHEAECPGAINSGMFLAMKESGDVLGTFVGHDHVNDYVGCRNGIVLGYGRWSGTKTTYGSDKITHGSRIIELTKDGGRSFKTWIRQRGGEKINELQIPHDLKMKK